jgi:hypothetical protein
MAAFVLPIWPVVNPVDLPHFGNGSADFTVTRAGHEGGKWCSPDYSNSIRADSGIAHLNQGKIFYFWGSKRDRDSLS